MLVDCQSILGDVKKDMKVITYQCNTTVAMENEKITNIQCPPIEAGKVKGPPKNIDLIEGCELICRVDVGGRKTPLKINIDYDISHLQRKDQKNGGLPNFN